MIRVSTFDSSYSFESLSLLCELRVLKEFLLMTLRHLRSGGSWSHLGDMLPRWHSRVEGRLDIDKSTVMILHEAHDLLLATDASRVILECHLFSIN